MGTHQVEPIHLLIIEDDPDQRELTREVLEDHFGRKTVTAVGNRAEAMALELDGFDMILTDYNLPDGSGMELLEEVRRRCVTPVIMVTSENVGHIAAEAVRKGAIDYVVKVGDYLFSIPLVVEKNLMVAKIIRENESLRHELEEKNAQLEELAATDPLTGLYNRRHFGRVLEQLFAEASRYGADLACVMIDLDGYKPINDAYGHAVGDQLLVVAGKLILANMRRMDVAARYGGDEFILLLPRGASEDAAAVVERIREEYRSASAAILEREQGVTMSVGIASILAGRPANADQLVRQADAALYQAKQAGRDRSVIVPVAAA
jgi:two-component system, cell cycle response regulator